MRTLAIGDVHGCFDALQTVLSFVAVSPKDCVVWLGDYVDRGPDSAKVIDFLSKLPEERNSFLRGNHEIMMQNARGNLNSLRSWAACGGDATWESYIAEFGGHEGVQAVPTAHWNFLDRLLPYFETDSHIFVHASLDSDVDLADQFEDTLFWGDFNSIGPHYSGKHTICGHTSQKAGAPVGNAHATCIDTWACGQGWLTCLDVVADRYYQANQAGEVRSDWLQEA